MRKQTIEYSSPLDALIDLAKPYKLMKLTII